jgi:peptide/nickel transport system substrate-binding protein
MKWNTPNPEFVTETLQTPGSATSIENPEAVKLWGDVLDWHHAIGTGPFIVKDFVAGSSATLVKNPNYYGYDERYPQNKLPYVDSVKYLIIPNDATALAAMRTGKIDLMEQMNLQQAQMVQKTNPEIAQVGIPQGNGTTIDPRNDMKPFSDVNVRKALQMAIDLPSIAKNYYGGTTDPSPLSLTSMYMKGWGWPYDQWPQSLKDEYAYNPTGAKKLLADAGYPGGFKTNIVVSSDFDMDLLQVVKSYFTAIGVDMEIRPMDTVAWSAFVVTSHKNDAMSARAAGNLGLGLYPLRQFTRFQVGQAGNMAMVNDPVFEAFYTKALAATTVNEVKSILRDTNEYIARNHFDISLLKPMQYSLCQPWVKGYNAQYGISSYPNGPQLLFLYGARFWIDRNLKNSMGH